MWELATYVSDSNFFGQYAVSQWCFQSYLLAWVTIIVSRGVKAHLRVFQPSVWGITSNLCHPAISPLQLVLCVSTFSHVYLNTWATDVAKPKHVFLVPSRYSQFTRTWDACISGLGLRTLVLLRSSSDQHGQLYTWLCRSLGLQLLVDWEGALDFGTEAAHFFNPHRVGYLSVPFLS